MGPLWPAWYDDNLNNINDISEAFRRRQWDSYWRRFKREDGKGQKRKRRVDDAEKGPRKRLNGEGNVETCVFHAANSMVCEGPCKEEQRDMSARSKY